MEVLSLFEKVDLKASNKARTHDMETTIPISRLGVSVFSEFESFRPGQTLATFQRNFL